MLGALVHDDALAALRHVVLDVHDVRPARHVVRMQLTA
jgi:hypothetical protein